MLKIGQVFESLQKQGFVCVVDEYEELAVRLVHDDNETKVYVKRKGRKEIPSKLSVDIIQETIHELNNKEISLEDYYKY